jgi:hypothetical protein
LRQAEASHRPSGLYATSVTTRAGAFCSHTGWPVSRSQTRTVPTSAF